MKTGNMLIKLKQGDKVMINQNDLCNGDGEEDVDYDLHS